MFSAESFLYKNEIRWMIALHCLQISRDKLQNMCYKIWPLCTYGRNHPKNIFIVVLQTFSLQLY